VGRIVELGSVIAYAIEMNRGFGVSGIFREVRNTSLPKN
jgi:hypothetical protein